MPDLTPEQRVRQQIDAQLPASGWVVQDFKAVNFSTGRGIALREVPLTTGPSVIAPQDFDYTPFGERGGLGRPQKVGGYASGIIGRIEHGACGVKCHNIKFDVAILWNSP